MISSSATSDYLIKKDMTEPDELPYKKRHYHLSERGKRIILILLSAALLIAVYVCLICDYFTAKKLSWSIISTAAIIAAWIVILPFLTAKTKIILKTLLAVNIVPIPLLAILALLLNRALVFTMEACISLVVIAAIWIMYGIFLKSHKNLWRAFGFALLVMISVPIAITHIVACFIPEMQLNVTSDVFNGGITLAISLIFFGMDYLFSQRKEDAKNEGYFSTWFRTDSARLENCC